MQEECEKSDEAHRAHVGAALIEKISDAVIYADRDGIIQIWNDGAVRIFGFSREEAMGKSLDIIIPERLRSRHWHGYAKMMQTGKSRYGPDKILSVPAQAKSGAKLSIQFTIAAVRDEVGMISGIVAVLRDFTDTYQELKRLRDAN